MSPKILIVHGLQGYYGMLSNRTDRENHEGSHKWSRGGEISALDHSPGVTVGLGGNTWATGLFPTT